MEFLNGKRNDWHNLLGTFTQSLLSSEVIASQPGCDTMGWMRADCYLEGLCRAPRCG